MKRILATIIVLMSVIPILAAEELTIDQAVTLALQSSEELTSTKISEQNAERTTETNTLLPSLTATAGVNTSGGLMSDSSIGFDPNYLIDTSLGIEASFEISNTDKYSTMSNQLSYESTILATSEKEEEIREIVTGYYLDVVSNILTLESTKRSYENYERVFISNLEYYEDGKIPKLTLKQSELSLLDIEQDLDTDKQSLKYLFRYSPSISTERSPLR